MWEIDQTASRERYKSTLGDAVRLIVDTVTDPTKKRQGITTWRAYIETGVHPGVYLRREFDTADDAMAAIEKKAIEVIRKAGDDLAKTVSSRTHTRVA